MANKNEFIKEIKITKDMCDDETWQMLTQKANGRYLRPCPFCGGDDLKLQSRVYRHDDGKMIEPMQCYYFVGCRDSGCFITGPKGDSEDEARKAWNLRGIYE